MVELILRNVSLLWGISTEDNFHVAVEERHGIRTDCIIVVAFNLLQFVSQILVVEDDAFAIADDPERSSPVNVDLSKTAATARISY